MSSNNNKRASVLAESTNKYEYLATKTETLKRKYRPDDERPREKETDSSEIILASKRIRIVSPALPTKKRPLRQSRAAKSRKSDCGDPADHGDFGDDDMVWDYESAEIANWEDFLTNIDTRVCTDQHNQNDDTFANPSNSLDFENYISKLVDQMRVDNVERGEKSTANEITLTLVRHKIFTLVFGKRSAPSLIQLRKVNHFFLECRCGWQNSTRNWLQAKDFELGYVEFLDMIIEKKMILPPLSLWVLVNDCNNFAKSCYSNNQKKYTKACLKYAKLTATGARTTVLSDNQLDGPSLPKMITKTGPMIIRFDYPLNSFVMYSNMGLNREKLTLDRQFPSSVILESVGKMVIATKALNDRSSCLKTRKERDEAQLEEANKVHESYEHLRSVVNDWIEADSSRFKLEGDKRKRDEFEYNWQPCRFLNLVVYWPKLDKLLLHQETNQKQK